MTKLCCVTESHVPESARCEKATPTLTLDGGEQPGAPSEAARAGVSAGALAASNGHVLPVLPVFTVMSGRPGRLASTFVNSSLRKLLKFTI